MAPASPVLIPCFKEADSWLQKERAEGAPGCASGSEGFADDMRGIISVRKKSSCRSASGLGELTSLEHALGRVLSAGESC
jgi:hypothetical protein